MAKLNPKSFIVTTTLKNIPIKGLFKSEEVVVFSQDSENDGEVYMASNPNSTDVRTATLSPTITGIVTNQYDVTDSGLVTVDDVEYLYYTPTDPTGIVVGDSVIISQGIALYNTSVALLDSGDVLLHKIAGEPGFTPANTDLMIFNHTTWYYVSSSLDKVAVGDIMQITLDDDASVQYVEVTYKDSTHIGFTISTTNYTSSDVILFESDVKLDGEGLVVGSNDYPNGLLVKHKTTDSTVTNLTIIPKTEYGNIRKFFF